MRSFVVMSVVQVSTRDAALRCDVVSCMTPHVVQVFTRAASLRCDVVRCVTSRTAVDTDMRYIVLAIYNVLLLKPK